jgi:hypothetical protein
MPGIKDLTADNWCEPDEANALFGEINRLTGEPRTLTGED